MISKNIIFLILLFSIPEAFAGPFWDKLIKTSGYKAKNHAFCYTNSEGELEGANIHKKSYLASTSKLFTTYAAVKKLGADLKLTTKLYYKADTKELHIAGAGDPVFSKRKLFYLVNQLNNAGINRINKLTFDENFSSWAQSENSGVAQSKPIKQSVDSIKKTLKAYLHTPEWNLNKKAYIAFIGSSSRDWLDFLRITRKPENLKLSIGSVSFKKRVPFNIKSNKVRSFNVLSARIEDYLKYTNILSHNYFADEFYRTISKSSFDNIFKNFMRDHFATYKNTRIGFKSNEPSIQIYNGSGYPLYNPRKDNYATCAIVVKMIEELDIELQNNQNEIQKIVAVTGVDEGTIKNRLRGVQFKNKAVVKTGTTNPVSAISGMMSTRNGRRFFGIFNHRWEGLSSSPLRSFQNRVIRKLMDDFGGGVSFKYTVKKMYPTHDLMVEK